MLIMLLFYIFKTEIFMKNYIKEQIKLSYETKQKIYENDELLNKIVDVAQKCVGAI